MQDEHAIGSFMGKKLHDFQCDTTLQTRMPEAFFIVTANDRRAVENKG
jgi:hypothetical protein